MPPYISEYQYYNDESLYENIVDEMYNPANYEFSSGDVTSSDYIDYLTSKSHVTIPNLAPTKAAYTKSKELGLFNLFFTEKLRQSIVEWTNTHYARSGTQTICKDDLDVFIGLEMAMSLKKGVPIKDNWSAFVGATRPHFILPCSFNVLSSKSNIKARI